MPEKNLQRYFNFPEFRPGQKEIIESILAGKDVVALMPTGGGKSLCYQLPAVMSEGVAVVISPLIALMKDQVDGLRARGIAAEYINSSLNISEIAAVMKKARLGAVKILYVAPERLATCEFRNFFFNLNISFLAVDEAHCVSQWGHDFRPDYLEIGKHIRSLPKRPTVAAFTATATPEVKEDIIKRLELQSPEVFVRGFDRPNLKFFVQKNIKPRERYLEVLRIIKSVEGSGIVYALTRSEAEKLADFLRQNDIAAAAYHAGMNNYERSKIQNDFMESKFKVIVATIAFGMGVDKADVRFVIHSGMPSSLESYYQEAGRAGRDGENAFCILLHSKKDASTHEFFIRKDRELMREQGKNRNEINRIADIKYNRLDKILEYVEEKYCRRRRILEYFGDLQNRDRNHRCAGCDVCLNWKRKKESSGGFFFHKKAERRLLSATVKETIRLWQKGYAPVQIAKIRSLGESAILNHLIDWYEAGGELDIEKLVSVSEESKIRQAIAKVGTEKLKPIKELLPEEISYEKIKLAVAKIKRDNNRPKAYNIEKIREEHLNAYEPWTFDDDLSLKLIYNKGKTIPELAKIFQRKEGAIRSRLKKLGLTD